MNPKPIQPTAPPAPIEPSPPTPLTKVVTKFVSGKRPGDFSIVTSTVVVDVEETDSASRKKREAITQPSPVKKVLTTSDPSEGFLDHSEGFLDSSKDELLRQRRDLDFVVELQSGMEDPTVASGATAGAAANGLHLPTKALFMMLP